ncbi:sugar transferase [Lacticaseibacillus porcinae]|uniref:sugar transferase n=1 Tax=Lacticaseibacillus porcinae TaxID=1123687 RepID=UPI001CDD8DA0|nr:sugar transferase [Lacticaseibacillus porcinae]
MESIHTHRARARSANLPVGYLMIKRAFDFVMAAAGLIVLAIPFLIIGLIIKFDDPAGGVFYSQTRVGLNGKTFRMWKFRSMVANADKMVDKLAAQNEITGAMFKIKDDPRITKIGSFIRKYSIDELPQLYNVLRGDMSMVGPRPPLPREVAEYTAYDKQRLTVTPGATGLWQVSGRSDVSFDDMVQLDIKYINEASVKTDLMIIVKTFGVMIKPNGAY